MTTKKIRLLKQVLTVFLSLGVAFFGCAQIPYHANSTAGDSPGVTEANKQRIFPYQRAATMWLSKGNIIIAPAYLQLSPIETEISDLEALEINALLKRD